VSQKLASLAMYDVGGSTSAALWRGLRGHLIAEGLTGVPHELTIPEDYEAHWLDPRLLLGQTCGYPLEHALAGRVQYVGTPAYDAPGVDGTFYRSAIVVRASDAAQSISALRGRRAAYNSHTSQSGYNAFRDLVAPEAQAGSFFSSVVETGSHRASLLAVIAGDADVAAIDAVTLAGESAAMRASVRIVNWTEAAPALPFITSLATSSADLDRLRRGIATAFADPQLANVRKALHLSGFEVLAADAYKPIVAMEQRAIALGYPALG